MITTFELIPGRRYLIKSYGQSAPAYRQKLLSIGLTHQTEIEVIRIAPLGCPIELKVRGAFIALRKNEAKDLIWEYLK